MEASGAREDPVLGRYLREIAAYPVLSREEEARLGRRIRAGDEAAVEELVTRNLRFVVMMARRYGRRGGSLADLVNEGNLGLMRAAERFDERKGVRFLTYAAWWVRQALVEATRRQEQLVRAPRRYRGPRRAYLSLDAGVADGSPLAERIADADQASPEGDLDRKELRRQVNLCVAGLPEREARVLRLCFGLDDGDPRELSEIARALGVSRTRVRQLRDRGLQRLRSGRPRRMLEAHRGRE